MSCAYNVLWSLEPHPRFRPTHDCLLKIWMSVKSQTWGEDSSPVKIKSTIVEPNDLGWWSWGSRCFARECECDFSAVDHGSKWFDSSAIFSTRKDPFLFGCDSVKNRFDFRNFSTHLRRFSSPGHSLVAQKCPSITALLCQQVELKSGWEGLRDFLSERFEPSGCLVMHIAGRFSGFKITLNRQIERIVKFCLEILVRRNIDEHNSFWSEIHAT
jgi:hypothetical protein